MTAPNERLFLAIPLPDFVKDALAYLVEVHKGFQWTEAANVHLTLKFIGDCTPEQREQIETALSPITVRQFCIQIGGLGVFPRRGHPAIIWAGVLRPHPHLFALHQHLNDTLFGIGIEPDTTRYIPHVTLARCGEASAESVKQFLKKHPDFETAPFFPESFCLIRSILGDEAPQHHVIWENPLGGPVGRRGRHRRMQELG
jgi:2'-5' RNA ligase